MSEGNGKRTKIVSFRVTDEEYQQLDRSRMARGARSISEYARAVTFQDLADNSPPGNHRDPLTAEIQAMSGRMDVLQRELKLLRKTVNGRAHSRRELSEPGLGKENKTEWQGSQRDGAA